MQNKFYSYKKHIHKNHPMLMNSSISTWWLMLAYQSYTWKQVIAIRKLLFNRKAKKILKTQNDIIKNLKMLMGYMRYVAHGRQLNPFDKKGTSVSWFYMEKGVILANISFDLSIMQAVRASHASQSLLYSYDFWLLQQHNDREICNRFS